MKENVISYYSTLFFLLEHFKNNLPLTFYITQINKVVFKCLIGTYLDYFNDKLKTSSILYKLMKEAAINHSPNFNFEENVLHFLENFFNYIEKN